MHCKSILSSGVFVFVASEINLLDMFQKFLTFFKQSIESQESWKYQAYSSLNDSGNTFVLPMNKTATVICPKFNWTESNIETLKQHSCHLLLNPSIESSSITIVVVSSINHVLLNNHSNIFHGCIQLPGMSDYDLLKLYHRFSMPGLSIQNLYVLYKNYTYDEKNMFVWDIFYLGDSRIPATCFTLDSSPFLIHSSNQDFVTASQKK